LQLFVREDFSEESSAPLLAVMQRHDIERLSAQLNRTIGGTLPSTTAACHSVFQLGQASAAVLQISRNAVHAAEVKDADGITSSVTTALFEALSFAHVLEDAEVMAGLVSTLLHISQWCGSCDSLRCVPLPPT
jgi:hypothetical protein